MNPSVTISQPPSFCRIAGKIMLKTAAALITPAAKPIHGPSSDCFFIKKTSAAPNVVIRNGKSVPTPAQKTIFIGFHLSAMLCAERERRSSRTDKNAPDFRRRRCNSLLAMAALAAAAARTAGAAAALLLADEAAGKEEQDCRQDNQYKNRCHGISSLSENMGMFPSSVSGEGNTPYTKFGGEITCRCT